MIFVLLYSNTTTLTTDFYLFQIHCSTWLGFQCFSSRSVLKRTDMGRAACCMSSSDQYPHNTTAHTPAKTQAELNLWMFTLRVSNSSFHELLLLPFNSYCFIFWINNVHVLNILCFCLLSWELPLLPAAWSVCDNSEQLLLGSNCFLPPSAAALLLGSSWWEFH